MIRATTGGVMKTYRSNLMGSFVGMNSARNTVLTQRTFNSYAEDPASAAKAFRLRKSRMMVNSQHDICYDTLKKYDSAVACLQSIDDILCTKDGVYGQYMTTLTGTTLSMLNDPEGDARTQLAAVLDQMSQSIIQTMNQKYGDNFIFAGADGHNVPFEIRDDGRLYYRGVWVDASIPNVMTQTGADGTANLVAVDGAGKIIDDPDAAIAAGQQVYYFNMDDVELVSIDELQEQIANTKVETAPDADGNDVPVAYKRVVDENDGSVSYQPIEDDEEYDGTVYYQLTDENGGTGSYITERAYNEAQEFVSNSVPMLYSADADGSNAASVPVDENGNLDPDGKYYLHIKKDSLMSKEDYDAAVSEYNKLKYLANEKYFVDIGYGFQENEDGKLIESSAFNASLNGITFIGWGLDEDGDPKNLYSLVQKMREVANSVDSGVDWDQETYDEFYRLVQKFEDGVSNYQTEFVNLDAGTGKLKMQEALLVDNFDNLQEQYSDLEDVDMVDAITSFLWAEYCYNAALKVGNSILGQSLMDYLS